MINKSQCAISLINWEDDNTFVSTIASIDKFTIWWDFNMCAMIILNSFGDLLDTCPTFRDCRNRLDTCLTIITRKHAISMIIYSHNAAHLWYSISKFLVWMNCQMTRSSSRLYVFDTLIHGYSFIVGKFSIFDYKLLNDVRSKIWYKDGIITTPNCLMRMTLILTIFVWSITRLRLLER